MPDGRTWPGWPPLDRRPLDRPPRSPRPDSTGRACRGRAGGTGPVSLRQARRSGASGGFLAGIPASPELLAKVAALPPATEQPGVNAAAARAPDPNFTLRRLLRPFLVAFAVGLVLDGLDALASLAMPRAWSAVASTTAWRPRYCR